MEQSSAGERDLPGLLFLDDASLVATPLTTNRTNLALLSGRIQRGSRQESAKPPTARPQSKPPIPYFTPTTLRNIAQFALRFHQF